MDGGEVAVGNLRDGQLHHLRGAVARCVAELFAIGARGRDQLGIDRLRAALEQIHRALLERHAPLRSRKGRKPVPRTDPGDGSSDAWCVCLVPGLRKLQVRIPRLEAAASQIPVARVGRPDDIAAAASFFCSEEAGFVSGQVLYVAGGPQD